jgi:hypothetical protein
MIRFIKAIFFPPRSFLAGVTILGLAFLGCSAEPPASSPSGKVLKPNAESAPPLKIMLLDTESLRTELELRWQSFSDQKLNIQSVSRAELTTLQPTTVDLLIYPGNLMGTLVAREWLSPVPKQAQDRIGGWEQALESSTWPSRWRGLSVFASVPMAAPLGAPSWVAITRSLDNSSLKKLHERILGNELTREVSEGAWNEFLSKGEEQLRETASERERDLQERLGDVGPEARRNLVCRYLWMLSTTESRYRGLFDMHKIQSRCSQPEFARSALHLRRLAVLQPSTIFVSPTEAWDAVAEGTAVFGLGWPRTDNQQRLTDEAVSARLDLIPILWNDGSGLVASIGKRTRQSASATEFLIWLAAEEQRIALQPKASTIELLEIDHDRNRVRSDYREYQNLQRLESAVLAMDLTPRFMESDLFLSLLGDALIDIFKSPETAEARMAKCRQDSDALVEQMGREKLRTSIESARGYSQ